MKNANANTMRNRCLTSGSGKNAIGLISLFALFLCSMTIPASAQWTKVTASTTFQGIQAGSTQVWARDSSGNPYQYSKGAFTKVTAPVPFSMLAVGYGDSVWAIDSAGNVFQYSFKTPKGFNSVPGNLTYISAGEEGVWGVNSGMSGGDVYVYNAGPPDEFDPPPNGEPSEHFESISVGNFTIGPWAIDSTGNAWLYNTDTEYFDETGGASGFAQISVGEGSVWGVTSSGTVWMYDTSSEKWVQPDPSANLSQIAVYASSNIWGVNSSGTVYKYNESKLKFETTTQPPEPVSVIRLGGLGVFVLTTSGDGYKY